MTFMNWKKALLKNFRLYAITDLKSADSEIVAKIDQALAGGVDIVQLRSKVFSDRELFSLAVKIRKITAKRKKLFIINDRVDLMMLADADGVHLGQDDMPIHAARKIVGKEKIIGISTHSIDQAIGAQKSGADYIGFGPLFETPTKPNYVPVGLSAVREVVRKITIPFVCIGGINETNIDQILKAGATRAAVVRAIFADPNPKEAARKLKQRMV